MAGQQPLKRNQPFRWIETIKQARSAQTNLAALKINHGLKRNESKTTNHAATTKVRSTKYPDENQGMSPNISMEHHLQKEETESRDKIEMYRSCDCVAWFFMGGDGDWLDARWHRNIFGVKIKMSTTKDMFSDILLASARTSVGIILMQLILINERPSTWWIGWWFACCRCWLFALPLLRLIVCLLPRGVTWILDCVHICIPTYISTGVGNQNFSQVWIPM